MLRVALLAKCHFFLFGLFVFTNLLVAQENKLKNDSSGTKLIDDSPRFFNTVNSTPFGVEGMGISTRLKGTSLLNISANPLIVVDGIPYMNVNAEGFDFTTADEFDYAALIGLSREDIKEISIVQDATSAAQYGSMAANGVILITTQRGTSRKFLVNAGYKNTFGVEPRGYEVLSGNEYVILMNEEFFNLNSLHSRPGEFDPTTPNPYIRNNYTQNTDWSKAISQKALKHNFNFSVSGGIGKLGYRFSTDYIKQKGTIINTRQDRLTTRLALDYSFSDHLHASFTMSYLHLSSDSSYQKNMPLRELALKKMPNASIYELDELGNYTGEYFTPPSIQGSNYLNPVALAKLSTNDKKNNRINPTFSLTYKPIEQLSYMFNASYIRDTCNGNIKLPFNAKNTDWLSSAGDYLESFTNKNTYFYTQNQITYTPFYNSRHSLTTVASFNTYLHKIRGSYSIPKTPPQEFESKYKSHYEIIGINYLAFNKYEINITGRGEKVSDSDFSSEYAINPAGSLQWHASRESFMKSLTFINNLSFYASYGEYSNPQKAVYLKSSIDEKSVHQDAGIKLTLFNRRLDFNLNYYSRKVNDQIVTYKIYLIPINQLFVSDYNSKPRWDIENEGWELNLQANLIKGKDFSIDFAMDVYKNLQSISNVSTPVMTQTNDDYFMHLGLFNGMYIKKLEEDKTVGSVSGYRYQGVYGEDAAAIARDIDGNPIIDINGNPMNLRCGTSSSYYIFQGGDAKYADLNHDGYINASDITTIGNVNPIFTGSCGPSFRYKSLWLGIYFNFRYGNDIVNMARMSLETMNDYDNQSKAVLKRWRIQGQSEPGMLPRAQLNNRFNSLGSDRFIENGSFLRLKAIILKYEFGDTMIKKLHLNNLSCYITCRNLFTVTDYQGADPDIMLNKTWDKLGYDNNYSAVTKEFTFGINVGI